MTPMFGRNMTEMCFIYNKMVDHIYQQHAEKLNDWNQPMLAPDQLQIYADTIHAKEVPLDSCFGVADSILLDELLDLKIINAKYTMDIREYTL